VARTRAAVRFALKVLQLQHFAAPPFDPPFDCRVFPKQMPELRAKIERRVI